MNRAMVRVMMMSGVLAALSMSAANAQTQQDSARTDNLPQGQGILSMSVATLQLSLPNLQIVFTPLDERVLRLVTKDSYQSMEGLIGQYRRQVDSVASVSGVTDPGIALVTFQGLAPNTRFDPEQLTLTFHGQQYHAAGWVALSPSFSNQQLDIRQQVQAIFVFRREIPVKEAFTLTYLNGINDDWQNRLPRFDSERTRILGTERGRARADTGHR